MITIVKIDGKQEINRLTNAYTNTKIYSLIKKRNTQNQTNNASPMYANKKTIERCLSPPLVPIRILELNIFKARFCYHNCRHVDYNYNYFPCEP